LNDLQNKGLDRKAREQTKLSKARQSAYRALSRRGLSRLELIGKLKRRGYTPGIISAVISHLETGQYLDDRAYAFSWAQKAVERRLLGPLVLRAELTAKGIDREVIEEIVQKIYADSEEEHLAIQASQKQLMRMSDPTSQQSNKRLIGHLMRKGFTSEVIGKVLGAVGQWPLDRVD
jgi:regulatory protein